MPPELNTASSGTQHGSFTAGSAQFKQPARPKEASQDKRLVESQELLNNR